MQRTDNYENIKKHPSLHWSANVFEQKQDLIANYICGKLYTYFVSPEIDTNIVSQMASTFVSNDFEIEPVLRQLFKQCKEKNKFVFEVCEVFGNELTIEEMEYWFVYDLITSATIYDVDITNMSFEAAVDEIDGAVERRRKRKWQTKSSQRKLPLPKR